MFTPGGLVVGSFQHMLWQRRRASEAAIWVSCTFAFVFSWYKCYIIVLFLGSSSIYSSHINHSGQDSITKIFFRASIFRSGLEACLNKNSNINPVSTKCRLQTGYKMQTRYKMQTENLYCFSVWTWQHVILQLTERHAIAFPRSSFTIICTNVEYPLPFLDHNRS